MTDTVEAIKSYPKAQPHDAITEVPGVSGVYMVRGTHPFNALMRISRNMTIIKHNDELTLVSAMRLSPEGEEELKKLGTVKRVFRLGFFHGVDDQYYKDTFPGVELWATGTSEVHPEPAIDKIVTEADELPFPDAKLVVFDKDMPKGSEAVLLIQRGGGLLLSADALQYYADYTHFNFLARHACGMMGFRDCCIGPPWLPAATPKDKTLEPDFERIMELEFEKLFAAHGNLLESGAKEAVRNAIDNVYKKDKK